MYLWLLRKPDTEYGQTFAMVVVAPTQAAARLVAARADLNRVAAFEWVDPDVTEVEGIGVSNRTESCIVLTKESAS